MGSLLFRQSLYVKPSYIENMKTSKVEWWIRVIISILSAVAGALGANAAAIV